MPEATGTGVLSDGYTDLRPARRAAELLRDFEDFSPTPYYDTNNWRIGFGSDTITLEDGRIIRLPSDPTVRPDYTITPDGAERDLARRLPVFERLGIVRYVGKSAWRRLKVDAKDALLSLVYNYGSLARLPSLVRAVKTGYPEVIADAVAARAEDNKGINQNRRLAEAELIRDAYDNAEEAPVPADMPEELRLQRRTPENDAVPAEQEGVEQAPIPQTPPDDLWVKRLQRLLTYDEPQAALGLGSDELMVAYRSIAEEEYIKARGNVGLAKRRALAALKGRYGVSRLSGQPVIMEQPPEANYPAIPGSGPGTGGWDYLRTLALQQARSTDPAAQEIALVSDSTTLADRKAGRPPRYALWYRTTDRAWSLAPAPFSVDLERLTQLQQTALEERRSRAAVAVARARELVEQGRPAST